MTTRDGDPARATDHAPVQAETDAVRPAPQEVEKLAASLWGEPEGDDA